MEKLRKIIFYTLSIGYLIFCPLLLLYSFGVILKPEGIIKTGLIYLATLPSGAEISINGKIQKEVTPTVVRDLSPAEYFVRVSKNGFLPWSQVLPVEEEKATVLDKILLIPEEWDKESFLAGGNNQVVPFSENTIFMIRTGPEISDIVVCDYRAKSSWPLIKKGTEFSEATVNRYYSVKGSLSVVVSVKSREEIKYFWIQLVPENNTVKEITSLFRSSPSDIKWEEGNNSVLFSLEEQTISKLDISTGAVYPDIIKGVKGFGLYGGKIYYIDTGGRCLTADLTGKERTDLIKDKELQQNLFEKAETISFEVYSDTFFTIIDNKGKLIANKSPYTFVQKGVIGSKYCELLDRMVVWTKEKLGIIDFSKEETGKVSFEKEPKVIWIYTEGRNIDQGYWVYQGSHILFKDGKKVYLMDVEGYGDFDTRKILGVQEKSGIIYSGETGELYFIDPESSSLMFVDIIPEAGTLPKYLKEIKKQKKRNKINEIWNTNLQETD